VAKTATQWRYFLNRLQDLPLTEITTDLMAAVQRVPVRKLRVPGRWLLVTSGTVALLFWNGRLVLATGVGMAVMALIYLMQDWRWQVPSSLVKQVLQTVTQPLVLAVGGGSAAMLTTYWAASVWAATESPWVATGGILQGVGTLAVLVILAGQSLHRQSSRERSHFNQYVADLTHADALRRLIAVRQLTRSLPEFEAQSAQRQELTDYFRLMVSRESEAMVRDALLDGLQALSPAPALKTSSQPVMPPTAMRRPRTKIKQRITTDF
jgi:hypothetical protein